MKVLILGKGAKDHAIAWWFSKSNLFGELFCSPGNIATNQIATNLPNLEYSNPEEVYKACIKNKISFVFVGTEEPLFNGVIDYLNERGIETFGATKNALKLEGDRDFARAFTDRHNIPTPRRNLFTSIDSLKKFLERNNGRRFVLKSNSNTPSRVMLDSKDTQALLKYSEYLFKKGPIFLEEHINGLAITVSLILDNCGYFEFPATADYMYSSDHHGLPTGGMGSICPIPIGAETRKKIKSLIVDPTIYGLKVESLSYKGVLTFSIILTENDDPILVDYHVRFSDPATQAMVPLIKNDAYTLLAAMKENKLSEIDLKLNEGATVSVVLASEDYPISPKTGVEIDPINLLFLHNCTNDNNLVFTGPVVGKTEDTLITNGGRCFTVVGKGEDIKNANKEAYRIINDIKFKGSWYRKDIGNKFFINSQT